jgi:hypothetical protein
MVDCADAEVVTTAVNVAAAVKATTSRIVIFETLQRARQTREVTG